MAWTANLVTDVLPSLSYLTLRPTQKSYWHCDLNTRKMRLRETVQLAQGHRASLWEKLRCAEDKFQGWTLSCHWKLLTHDITLYVCTSPVPDIMWGISHNLLFLRGKGLLFWILKHGIWLNQYKKEAKKHWTHIFSSYFLGLFLQNWDMLTIFVNKHMKEILERKTSGSTVEIRHMHKMKNKNSQFFYEQTGRIQKCCYLELWCKWR